jgi:hypothetical protein
MNAREVVRRLKAFHEGRPLVRGETKHIHISPDSDCLIVDFVRMGGESRPWGIAFGKPGKKPKILSVPEGRNRDLVAGIAAEFAPTLLKHLSTPAHCGATEPAEWEDLLPLRQVWLPNPTHLNMLHHLAYAYTFTKWGAELRPRLNALGRACGWLFREAQRPGNQAVVVASDALRGAYTFPAEEVRQGHLGFLLAWLEAHGDRDTRLDAALEAEQQTVAVSLDPELERSVLESHVDAWGVADREGDAKLKKRAAKAISATLKPELERRWQLTETALAVLRTDPRRVNAGIDRLVTETAKEQWAQHTRLELKLNSDEDGPAFFPSVETDRHPAAAASRFFVYNSAADLVEGLLVHDDCELLAEAIAEGDAIKGKIVEVWDEAPERAGRGRASTRPVWVLRDEADRPLRLRTGSDVSVVGVPNRKARIRELRETDDGALEIELEIINLKTRKADLASPHNLAPKSEDFVGEEIACVTVTRDGISRTKSFKIWRAEGPGAWLTHGRPGGVAAQVGGADRDDVDAVEQAGGGA